MAPSGPGAEVAHRGDGAPDDAGGHAGATGMDGPDDAGLTVVEKHRHAVGDEHAEREASRAVTTASASGAGPSQGPATSTTSRPCTWFIRTRWSRARPPPRRRPAVALDGRGVVAHVPAEVEAGIRPRPTTGGTVGEPEVDARRTGPVDGGAPVEHDDQPIERIRKATQSAAGDRRPT